jgi:Flp pilus assembly pilin Flp
MQEGQASKLRGAGSTKQLGTEEGNMDLLRRLWAEEEGQGLVEYTFVVMLAALVFWLGVRDTDIGASLAASWAKVEVCVRAPFSCTA